MVDGVTLEVKTRSIFYRRSANVVDNTKRQPEYY